MCAGALQRASSPDVHNLESHLETGSLAPISCGAGETEEVSKVAERVDECIQQLQDLEELQHKLFLEYPHGIPVSDSKGHTHDSTAKLPVRHWVAGQTVRHMQHNCYAQSSALQVTNAVSSA